MIAYFIKCFLYAAVLCLVAHFCMTTVDSYSEEIGKLPSVASIKDHYDPLIAKAESKLESISSGYGTSYDVAKKSLDDLRYDRKFQIEALPKRLDEAKRTVMSSCLIGGAVVFVVSWILVAISSSTDARLVHWASSYPGEFYRSGMPIEPTGTLFGVAGFLMIINVVIVHPVFSIGAMVMVGISVLLGVGIAQRGYSVYSGTVQASQGRRQRQSEAAYKKASQGSMDDFISVSDIDDE